MPETTPRGVPYPTAGDRANVPRDLKALAEWVDANTVPFDNVEALAQALLATGLFGSTPPVSVLVPDVTNPGFYVLAGSGLIPDPEIPGFLEVGTSGLVLDPLNPGFYLIGA